ncbi:MAG: hypothetical protein J7M08_00785 [Planctomycetes bacterium]|nr:hypothetical protein [Planctomycetota bacterium]
MERAALQLSIQDVALLLNLALERRELTGREAIQYVKEKFKRSKASTRAHLRRQEELSKRNNQYLTL